MSPHDFEQTNSLNEYQFLAHETATYPDMGGPMGFFYLVSKLAGEAGEVAEKFGKQIRDKGADFADPEFRDGIKKELGDVAWYVSEIALQFGWNLSEVAATNINKLYSRKDRGVLGGSGDNR